MSERIDDILDLIDGGLQTSPEHGYGRDHTDLCARCQHHDPAEGGDLCEGCRAFLLGDTDDDPAEVEPSPRPPNWPDPGAYPLLWLTPQRPWPDPPADVQPYLDEMDRTIRMMFRARFLAGHNPTFAVTDELAEAVWTADSDCQEWVDDEGVW